MVIGIAIEVLDGQSSCLFSNEPFEKRPVTRMTIKDFILHFDDHFILSGTSCTTADQRNVGGESEFQSITCNEVCESAVLENHSAC